MHIKMAEALDHCNPAHMSACGLHMKLALKGPHVCTADADVTFEEKDRF